MATSDMLQQVNQLGILIGHPPFSRMNFLHRSISHISAKDFHCSVYPIAKQRRLSFPIINSCITKPSELVHSDIWRPFSYSPLEGYWYFITLVDDFSIVTWYI